MIFWGAGATADAGFRVTADQAAFLSALTPNHPVRSRADRVQAALGAYVPPRWAQAVSDLLAIIGDADADADDIHRNHPTDIHADQLDAMRRNWSASDEHALRRRIVHLRTLYDWPALVAAIRVCPNAPHSHAPTAPNTFGLADLFNILDLHQQSGHGFSASDGHFLTPQRVLGARMALSLLLQTIMYVDWHTRCRTRDGLAHHYAFALALARRMQQQGIHRAAALGSAGLETRDFVLGDLGFVSMNWDPLGLWAQFVANRDLNQAADVPLVGNPPRRLWAFHDLGHFVAGPRVDKGHEGSKVWQPMNESSARQLNDPDHGARVCVRVSKYLFPHGSLWWRECPNCGQLSSFIGDVWRTDSDTLLPPPPLRAFVDGIDFASWKPDVERAAWNGGKVDARACVHCDALTFAHHTPLVTQTNLKTVPPPFLEEIQREMRVVVQGADHIVLLGYSLPSDDVVYRAFLAARTRRDERVRCSVVTRDSRSASGWTYLDAGVRRTGLPNAVASAESLFGAENVRFHGGGFPAACLDGGTTVTDAAVERLLRWDPF
ncbi:MAG: hypothetical protein OXU21_01730 [Chloroflexota bacterium]|nr:hypothetical protein [Chloroflexota bacterium]